MCGVAGIKPTTGRVPRTGHSPDFRGLFQAFTQLGPIARRVEDLELILPIISGPDGVDPSCTPCHSAMRVRSASPITRVAVFTDNGVTPPTPDTAAAVRSAATALVDDGAVVDERRPPGLDEVAEVWASMISADGHAWLSRLIAGSGTPGHGSYDTRGWVEFGEAMPGDELTAMIERADGVRSRMLRWMADVDVMVCPAMPQPAILHGGSNDPTFGDTYSDVHNLTGFPAVVVRGGTAPGWTTDRRAAGRRPVAGGHRARRRAGGRGGIRRVAATAL